MTDMAVQGLMFVLIGAGLTGFSAESTAAMRIINLVGVAMVYLGAKFL